VGLLRERECSVLGAALLGAVAAGYFTDIGEAVSNMVSVSQELEPRLENRAIYDNLLDAFRDAYKALSASGFYQKLQT
jgi:xylulokinase